MLRKTALVLSALGLLGGCQQPLTGSAGGTFTYTPTSAKRLMVDLPVSLTPTAPPTMATAVAASARVASSVTPTSIGYQFLYEFVSLVKIFTPATAQFGVLADALIVQNNLAPSSTLLSGKSVTVTEAMVAQMKTALPAGFALVSAPAVGPMTMPDFVFNLGDNSNFRYSLSMRQATGTTTIYWNDDKSKFGMTGTMTGTSSGSHGTFFFANDEATQSTFMNFLSSNTTTSIYFKADPAKVLTHGVFVSLVSKTTGASPSSSSLSGYGDDLGGAADFTLGSGPSASIYREVFNAQGKVTSQAYSFRGAAGSLVSTFGTPSTTYDAKLTNTNWGNAPQFFP